MCINHLIAHCFVANAVQYNYTVCHGILKTREAEIYFGQIQILWITIVFNQLFYVSDTIQNILCNSNQYALYNFIYLDQNP